MAAQRRWNSVSEWYPSILKWLFSSVSLLGHAGGKPNRGWGGKMFSSGNVTVYVSNMDAAVRALEAKGVKFHGPVRNDGKAGSFVSFDDPDGNLLYLAQLNWSHVEQGEGKYQETR